MTTTTLKLQIHDRFMPFRSRLGGMLAVAMTWHARARQRRHLAGLSLGELKDIGVSRADALNEAEKPFWQE
jgi:uncharacterized protein YjiS (DUF1127 family)